MSPRIVLLATGVLLWAALVQNGVEACSCLLQHPQTHFCNADFVIVARVKKITPVDGGQVSYKLKIKKELKMSEKARIALKSGKLMSAESDAMCGIELNLHETYVISGDIWGLVAHSGLCNWVQRWRNVSARQRKGLRLLYKRGCDCKVSTYSRSSSNPNSCPGDSYKCHERHGVCLRSHEKCQWMTSPALRRCLNGMPEMPRAPRRTPEPTR